MNELTLAGSRFVFYLAFGNFMPHFKSVSLKSSSLKTHVATQGEATYHATSCKRLRIISSGSRESNGHRPHLGNATPLASSSIHGEHRNDLYSNSKKHQGDLSWMPSVTVALLAPGRVLRRSFGLVPLAREMALIRMRLPLARSWSLLQPLLVFLLPPPQPAFCVRPEGWAFAATLCFSFLAMFSSAKGRLRSYNSSRNLCVPSKGTLDDSGPCKKLPVRIPSTSVFDVLGLTENVSPKHEAPHLGPLLLELKGETIHTC